VSLGAVEALNAALERGEIDVWIWSLDTMWRIDEEKRGRAILAFNEIVGADWHEFAIATTSEVLQNREKSKAVSRFIEYWRALVRKYSLEPENSIALMAERPPKGYGMSTTVAQRFYHAYKPNYLGSPNEPALLKMREILDRSGAVKNPPPIQQWFSGQYL
ncbi:MAG: hypothetical protein RMH74_01265, partial [Candidatus Caldarchaeum sp.]|nr:hypothetical protein [Candidatus Caldarchaeum sp.]